MDAQRGEPKTIPAYLDDCRIKGLPSSGYYIADFITPEEEQVLLEKVCLTSLPNIILTNRTVDFSGAEAKMATIIKEETTDLAI